MSQLSDEVLEQSVKAELIHPHVRRAEIKKLRKVAGGEGKQDRKHSELPTALKELAAGGRFEFMVPKDIGAAACAQMRQIIHVLQKKFGVEIASLQVTETAANGVVVSPVSSGSGGSPVNQRSLVRVHPELCFNSP